MKYDRKRGGFTLLELMVVITIIALLATLSMPGIQRGFAKAKRLKDISNQRGIVFAVRNYASDNDGAFPFGKDEDIGQKFGNSTDAFQELLDDGYLDSAEAFFFSGNPDKPAASKSLKLTQAENCYTYVMGLSDTSPGNCPVVADEQESAGTYGAKHPWLDFKVAVIGYVDGTVKEEKLDKREPGAKVKVGSIPDIFVKRQIDDSTGENSGGLLPASAESGDILIP